MVAASVAALGFGVQSAQGTPAGSAEHRLALLGGGLVPNRAISDLEETSGSATNRMRSATITNTVSAEGSPEFAMRVSWIADMLYLALGATSGGGGTTTIVPAATIPYSTWWSMLAGIIFDEYRDVKVSQLVITSEASQPVRVQATLLGIDPRSDSSDSQSAVTIDTSDPFMHYDGEGAFEVDGDIISCIERVVLTINNNASTIYGDSLHGCMITEGLLDITVETLHAIENADTYNLFHYGEATPSDATQVNPNPTELTAGIDFTWTSDDGSVNIVVPRLQIQSLAGYEPSTDPSAPLRQTATYKALLPDTGAGLTAVVTEIT